MRQALQRQHLYTASMARAGWEQQWHRLADPLGRYHLATAVETAATLSPQRRSPPHRTPVRTSSRHPSLNDRSWLAARRASHWSIRRIAGELEVDRSAVRAALRRLAIDGHRPDDEHAARAKADRLDTSDRKRAHRLRRQTLDQLRAAGWTWRRIIDATGLTPNELAHLRATP